MNASGTCVDRDTWRSLLDERVTAEDRHQLLAHLDECPACTATVADLADQWSLVTLLRELPAEGPATLAIRERLAAAGPGPAPPRIPGIADLELAGRGGMGAVYRGRDTRLGRLVAVKVLAGAGVLSPQGRGRAEREARALARLDHPNVVRIHAALEVEGMPVIVMEWIDGETLQARLDSEPLAADPAAAIAAPLARALAAVHAVGIVHRDLKPANVLLATAAGPDGPEVPKLVDFGLARPDDEPLSRATAVLGTPAYMAPEQTGLEPALGNPGPASDIHALGGVLYAMLTSAAPYDAPTAGESLRRAARADYRPFAPALRVPADLRTIVETCLAYEPARRYRSAGDLADDLERFLARRPIAARPAGPLGRLRDWSRRHPVAAVAAALGLAVMVAGSGAAALHTARLERARAGAAASDAVASASRDLARESLERLTDESIESMLRRGPALGAKDREFLRSVADQFCRWPLEPDPRAAVEFRARGLQRVADLFRQLNRFDEALACQEDVLAAFDEAARRGLLGGGMADRRLMAEAARRQLLHVLGRTDEALVATRTAAADLERLAVERPDLRGTLAATLVDLAIAEDAAGDREAAGSYAARGLELFAAATVAAPLDPAPLEEEIRALYNTALLSLHAGRITERRDRLDLLVARCEEGLRLFPARRAAFTRSLLLGLTGLAGLDLAAGRPEEAMTIASRRAAVARAAAAADPDEPLFTGERVDAAIQLAACHEALGRPGDARPELEAAVRLAEAAVEREPAVQDRSRLLASALERQARNSELVGDPTAAVAARDRLATVLAPWKDGDEVAAAIADQLVEAARLLESQGDRRAARERLERALTVAPADRRPVIESRLAAAEP
jgi:tetratricopeptide (TPR) repeat protein